LRKLLKPDAENPRPLLVNFWATWCPPCLKEFPDLVRIDQQFRSRGLNFIVVSVDDFTKLENDVPKFLKTMKAKMPAYLLTEKRDAVASTLIPFWTGGIPATILYESNGEIAYFKAGRINAITLRSEIEQVLARESSRK
jgi:thiol-disulfide isomerase/thioredoxin